MSVPQTLGYWLELSNVAWLDTATTESDARTFIIDEQMEEMVETGLAATLIVGPSGHSSLAVFQNYSTLRRLYPSRYKILRDVMAGHSSSFPESRRIAYIGGFISNVDNPLATAPTAGRLVDLSSPIDLAIADEEIDAIKGCGITECLIDLSSVPLIDDTFMSTYSATVSALEMGEFPKGRFMRLRAYFASKGLSLGTEALLTGARALDTMDENFKDIPQFIDLADLIGASNQEIDISQQENFMYLRTRNGAQPTPTQAELETYIEGGWSIICFNSLSATIADAALAVDPELLTP